MSFAKMGEKLAADSAARSQLGTVAILLPIIEQKSAPAALGSYTDWAISGTPGGPFTATFRGQTTDPIAADATADDIAAAIALLSTVGNGNVRAYPGFGSGTLPSAVYIQFIGTLAGPVEAFTVSDGALTVAADSTGIAPDPVGIEGQLFINASSDIGFGVTVYQLQLGIWVQIFPISALNYPNGGSYDSVNLLPGSVAYSLSGQNANFLLITVDPSAGAGVVAPIGSSASKVDDGTEWKKTGAGATQWQKLAFVA